MKARWMKVAGAVVGIGAIAGVGAALALDEVGAPGPIEFTTASDDAAPDQRSDAAASDDAGTDERSEAADVEPADGASLDEAEARRLAVEEVGGGEAVHIRADRDDGRPEWEVLVRDADGRLVEVTLDAIDGRVLETDVEDDDDDHRGAAVEVSEQEATEIALEAVGGGEVLQVTADEDDGRAEWEIDVTDADGRSVEVTIDATDGQVLEVDVED